MSEGDSFSCAQITDEDIHWVTSLLGLPEHAFYGKDRNDRRQQALKSMEQMDIAACPGSGKTTLLVAKLAILAEKWQYRTRGMCVLSHTNAARREIETRLGNTAAGRHLLSYPHFIGTIHRFVNEFLAIPWVRSLGYPIEVIDTGICLKRRWSALPPNIRNGLEKAHRRRSVLTIRSSDFSVGDIRWGGKGGQLGHTTPTYQRIQDVCRNSVQEGYFCYDEMFLWAGNIMDKTPGIIEVLRQRFPILFIDEAQDNSEAQSSILYRIFMEGDRDVIRQRFGDPNQAIFNFVEAKGAETDVFPNGTTMDLPNSHRFGQEIADLADPLGLRVYDLRGQGPKKPLASRGTVRKHTIFLFDDSSAQEVLKAYAELLIDTFSEEELREGVFTAVGMVHHQRTEETDKFPRHVAHYWPDYDPELTRQDPRPQTFPQYVFAGRRKAEESGEAYPVVEKIAEGVLHLANMAQAATSLRRRKYIYRYVMNLLGENAATREQFEALVTEFAARRYVLTKKDWNERWRGIARQIAETIAGSTLLEEANNFLRWKDVGDDSCPPNVRRSQDNVYRYPNDEPKVCIEVGSIHSVKGKENTATLVLETFWHKHNLETLRPWITGDRMGWKKSDGVRQQTRLKVHYVAMTRSAHLLCLATKRSTFESGGDLDQELMQRIKQRGWQILDMTDRRASS